MFSFTMNAHIVNFVVVALTRAGKFFYFVFVSDRIVMHGAEDIWADNYAFGIFYEVNTKN